MQTILGISASSRIWGNSETSIKLALLSAMETGAQADFVRLSDLTLNPCRGCFTCLSEVRACAIHDDLPGLLVRIREAGALILAAPVYFGLPPGTLVNLLDRLLVTAADDTGGQRAKPAVTITLMGNSKWRGIAEPIVNLTASLLGFEIVESLSIVAEGPGAVLGDGDAVAALRAAGRSLASDARDGIVRASSGGVDSIEASAPAAGEAQPGQCPTCKSDFFRIERDSVTCPVCGGQGDLAAYLEAGRFVRVGDEQRWGTPWLRSHVASWVKPSVTRYRAKRKEVLRDLAELKRLYSAKEKEG